METKVKAKRRNGKVLHAKIYNCYANGVKKPPIVIACHGFPGTKDEGGRFPAVARALNDVGIDFISFDFAGYGENEREPIFLSKQIENLEDIVEFVKSQGYTSYGTLGLSFGGQTSLLTDLPDRKAAVFWAPAFYMSRVIGGIGKHFANFWMRVFGEPVLIGNYDYESVMIERKFTKQMYGTPSELIDNSLAKFITPARIIQGSADLVVRPWITKEAYSKMPQDDDHDLQFIKMSGHNFHGDKLAQFVELTVDWFQKYL